MSEIIYKFQTFNLNSLSSIINSQLWFSSPGEFNDPLDCTIKADITHYPVNSNATDFYKAMAIEFPKSFPFKEKFEAFNKNHNVFDEDYKLFFDLKTKKNIVISCFSKLFNHPLMWAHYAEGHTGFCLGFDREVLEEKFGKNVIHDVQYPYKRIPIKVNANPDPDKPIAFDPIQVFNTKYRFWRYEKEVRAILYMNDEAADQLVSYPQNSLKEIVFGFKMDEKKKELLMKTNQNSNIIFYNGFLNELTGEIEKVKY